MEWAGEGWLPLLQSSARELPRVYVWVQRHELLWPRQRCPEVCAPARAAALGLLWECCVGITGCSYMDWRRQGFLLLHKADYCAECLELSGVY